MVHIDADHPLACMAIKTQYSSIYIREHRLVMAQHFERPLYPWEVVHHKNRNKGDNRIENLQLLDGQAVHQAGTIAHNELLKLRSENKDLRRKLKDCRAALQAVEGS